MRLPNAWTAFEQMFTKRTWAASGSFLQAKAGKPRKADDKSNIVFVGGLRKSTTEESVACRTSFLFAFHGISRHCTLVHLQPKLQDKVAGHFSKFGQVDSV